MYWDLDLFMFFMLLYLVHILSFVLLNDVILPGN